MTTVVDTLNGLSEQGKTEVGNHGILEKKKGAGSPEPPSGPDLDSQTGF